MKVLGKTVKATLQSRDGSRFRLIAGGLMVHQIIIELMGSIVVVRYGTVSVYKQKQDVAETCI